MQLAILLATYNSEKYIHQQIDSLLNQTYKDFRLFIRDDDSSDNTPRIITQYAANHSNITILRDPIKKRRSMGSFMYLLENSSANYYMFCDHDDVWLPNKIELSIGRIKEIEQPNSPALVCSDLYVVDDNLNIIDNSFWSYMKLNPTLLVKKRYAQSCNLFTGCTMIINQKTKEISLPVATNALMHDSWIGLKVIALKGNIAIISTPLIYYRQHQNNVCGAQEIGSSKSYYINKIIGINKVVKMYKSNFKMAKSAFENKISLVGFLFWRIIYLMKR